MLTISLTEKLKALYRAQDTLPKLIEDASVPTQKMDDYYVKLQIVLDEKKEGIVSPPIDIGKIFDPFGDQGSVGKVLIVGGAGVGKTTLLNHITYEWSRNNIFGDKFDYVIKIRLKNLLNKHLCNEIADLEDIKDQLPLLIQRSLEQQQLEQKNSNTIIARTESEAQAETIFDIIALEDLKNLDVAKTLLVLDGYDEIEHLDRGGHIAREIMNSIFDYPNVLITSRPNAISSNIESRFERKIENVGIGQDGARAYIENYFGMQSKALVKEVEEFIRNNPTKKTIFNLLNYLDSHSDPRSKELEIYFNSIDKSTGGNRNLESFKQSISKYYNELSSLLLDLYQKNPSLKEILATPINAAMICLISSDSEIMNLFTKDFKLGDLYNGVIIWLGKRYLHKFENAESKNIYAEMVLDRVEISVLKTIAHDKFKLNEIFIPGKEIHRAALYKGKTFGISAINKIGLLKADNNFFAYELRLLDSAIDETDVQPGKIYLYLTHNMASESAAARENDLLLAKLTYILQGRNGIEKFVIDDELASSQSKKPTKNGLGESLLNIKKFLIARRQHLDEVDETALAEYIANKSGYVVQKHVSSRTMAEAIEANDLIHRKYAFIHLSFQEFLTAYNLKELLLSNEEKEYRTAAQFIGEHRNEPRYLFTLKFLAEMVTNDQSENSNLLVMRFWEAVTCNVDGLIELGLDAKVMLLMHLLEKAKINGELDKRIPNLDKITSLIDLRVINNLSSYDEHIIASGYTSSKIIEMLLKMLNLDYQHQVEEEEFKKETFSNIDLQISMRLTLKLVENAKLSGVNIIKLIDTFLALTITISEWEMKQNAIKCLISILKINAHSINCNLELSKNIINSVQFYITDENLKLEVFSLIKLAQEIAPTFGQLELNNYLLNILDNHFQLFQNYESSKTLNNIGLHNSFEKILNRQLIKELIKQGLSDNLLYQYNAITHLNYLIKHNPEIVNDSIYNLYENMLSEQKTNILLKAISIQGIEYISLIEPTDYFIAYIINIIESLDDNCDYKFKIIKILINTLDRNLELLDYNILDKLINLGILNNEVKELTFNLMKKVAEEKTELLNINTLIKQLNIEDYELNLRNANIILTKANDNTDFRLARLDFMQQTLKHFHFKSYYAGFKNEAAYLISFVHSFKPELFEEIFTKMFSEDTPFDAAQLEACFILCKNNSSLINADIMIKILDVLSSHNLEAVFIAAKIITFIAKNGSSYISIEQLMDLFDSQTLYINENFTTSEKAVNELIEQSSSYSFNQEEDEITSEKYELNQEASMIEQINYLLDSDPTTSSIITMAFLSAICQQEPELIKSSHIKLLNEYLNSDTLVEKLSAISLLKAIVETKINLVDQEIVLILLDNLTFNKLNLFEISNLLETIINKNPSLISIDDIISTERDKDTDINLSIRLISLLAKSNPVLLNTNAVNYLADKLVDGLCSVRAYEATNALLIVAKNKSDLLTKEILDKLIKNLIIEPYKFESSSTTHIHKKSDIVGRELYSMYGATKGHTREYINPLLYPATVNALKIIAVQRPDLFSMDNLISQINDLQSAETRYKAIVILEIIANEDSFNLDPIILETLLDKLEDTSIIISTVAACVIVSLLNNKENMSKDINFIYRKFVGNSFLYVPNQQVLSSLKSDKEANIEVLNYSMIEELVEDLNDKIPNQKRQAAISLLSANFIKALELFNIQQLLEKLVSVKKIQTLSFISELLANLFHNRSQTILAEEYDLVLHLLNSEIEDFRFFAANIINVLIDKAPQLQDYNVLMKIIRNEQNEESQRIKILLLQIIQKLATQNIEVMNNEVLELLINDALANNSGDKQSAEFICKIIEKIVEQKPQLINIPDLISKLEGNDYHNMKFACIIIRFIPENTLEQISLNTELFAVAKLQENDINIKVSIIKLLKIAIKNDANFLNTQFVHALINTLSSKDKIIRDSISEVLALISNIRQDLINTSTVNYLINAFKTADYDLKSGIISTLGELASKSSNLISSKILTKFLSTLKELNNIITQELIIALNKISKTNSNLITSENIDTLVDMLKTDNVSLIPIIIEIFTTLKINIPVLINFENILDRLNENFEIILEELLNTNPELINYSMLNKAISRFNNFNILDGLKIGMMTNFLGMIIEKRANIIDGHIINKLIKLLDNKDYQISSSSAQLLISIFGTRGDLINYVIFEKLEKFIGINSSPMYIYENDNSIKYIRCLIPFMIGIVARERYDIAINYLMWKNIENKINDSNDSVRFAVASALYSIAVNRKELVDNKFLSIVITRIDEVNPQILNVVAKTLCEIFNKNPSLLNYKLVENIITSFYMNAILKTYISQILEVFANGINSVSEIIKVLDNPKEEVRTSIIGILINILSNKVEQNKIKIQTIFSIIAFYDPNDKEKKYLIELAKKVLDQKLPFLQDEDIEHMTQNYDDILALSAESLIFFKKVYAQVLSDGVITVIEKDFMIKSIERGVATSFTSEGKIIFEGRTYEINEDSKPYFNGIIRASLSQKDDILVEQYNEYQPIFENHQTGMKLAANDIADVNSLANSFNKLNNHEWHITFMHLSNHRKSVPKSKFILLERRDEFGALEVHKILLATDGIIEIKHYIKLPMEVNRSFREEIFGLMSYVDAKPRYFTTIFKHIELNKGEELLEVIVANKDKFFGSSELESLFEIIRDNIASFSLLSDWETYLLNQNTIELKKYDLLDYKLEQDKTLVRQDSTRIEEYDRTHNLEARVDSIEDKISKLNIGALESIVAKEQLSQKEQLELSVIENDPYKFALYQAIRWQLNSLYLASSAIATNMVENQSTGTLGGLGSFLETISSQTPLIGIGVNLLGQVLIGIDQSNQAERVNYYANLVPDSVAMAKLAELVARRIAITERDFSQRSGSVGIGADQILSVANTVATAMTGAASLASGAQALLQDGIVGTVASSYSAIKASYKNIKEQSKAGDKPTGLIDFAQRFIEGVKTDPNDPKTKGENDAATVAALITENIFKGKYKQTADATKIAELIFNNVAQEYGVIEQELRKLSLDENSEEEKSEIDQQISDHEFIQQPEEVQPHNLKASSISQLPSGILSGAGKRFISDETFQLLVQENADSIRTQLNMEQFKVKTFDFEVSRDIIKEIADIYLGRGQHNIIRGKNSFNLLVCGKINLTKELKAGASSIPQQVSGKTIIDTLIRCKLEGALDLSRLNALFDTEEHFRFAKPFSSGRDDGHNQEARFISDVVYNNLLLSRHDLLQQVKIKYGADGVNDLISLGTDQEVARIIIESIEQSNAENVLSILFDKIPKIDSGEQTKTSSNGEGSVLAITEETNHQSNNNHNNDYKSEHSFKPDDNLALTAFTAKEAIESLPTLKYFAKEILQIQYNLPEFVDNNYFKLTAHFVATNIGAYSLIGKFSIVSSLLPTAVYGSKVLAYEYLSQQKQLNFEVQEDKSIDSPIEFAQKCGFDIAAQTALGIVSSFISGSPAIYDMAISATIGGMQCYSQYNHKENIDPGNIISTGEKIIPYVADTITYYIAINNMQFDLSSTARQMLAIKQGLTVLSSVVMTDYVTKLAISSMPEGYFNCEEDGVLGRIYSNFGWECNNDEV